MLGTCLDNVRKTTPLVHNITNYVTVNDVANILLACGASPIMSDEPEDVEDITSICGGLDINMGRGAIVIGLAAVIIGEVVFGKISRNFAFSLLTVALGSIIYYLVLQVVLWFGLNSNDLKLLSAIVVAVFLAIPYMKRKYFSRPVKKGGARRA